MPIFTFRSSGGTGNPSVCFWSKGLPVLGSSLWPGLGTEDIHKVHGCFSGPFGASGHSCTQLPGRLAHTGPLQGVSELSQRYRPPPHSCSWPQNEHQKECSHPFSRNGVLGVYLDSVQMQARLAPAWISSFNTCLARFKRGHHVSVSTCRRLLGLMATASPVLLLAHKLPGAQSRLPGTNLLSLLSQEVSCDSQDGQHGGGIPYKSPWGFTVAHPEQACAPSSPLVSGQVPLPESGSRSGSFEPCSQFSVETEAQAGGMVVEPSNSGPDLGSVRRSGSVPLCIAGVVPKPALVLPEFLVLLEFLLGTYQ